MTKIYLIGSLSDPSVREVAAELRKAGFEVFDDWHAPGPDADKLWRDYELERGRGYAEALQGAHARNVFNFDKRHIDEADVVVLASPKGKVGGFSAGLELAYACWHRKIPTFILLNGEPERWDVMTLLGVPSYGILYEIDQLVEALGNVR